MKWIYKFLLLTLIHVNVFAQTPEKMSYQAVIRDNSDVLVKNSQVDLKIIIRKGSPKGSSVYEEIHHIKSNKNGLVTLEIGTGSIEKGFFSEINWSEGLFFIETLIDPEGHSNYTINGISQMLSVPYALHAKSADSFTGIISPSQMPDFYTADQVDAILEAINTAEGVTQSLKLNKHSLAISGANTIQFENWDINAADDFSGNYEDLQNKPELFSGLYADLHNKPELFNGEFSALKNLPNIYTVEEVDKLIEGIVKDGGVSQNLKLNQNTLSISGGNSISFENWDTDARDDFSGSFKNLTEVPELYTKNQVDSLVVNLDGGSGMVQSLNLEAEKLSISGGNSISFENWDTDGSDDFSGNYTDLKNTPTLFSGKFADLSEVPELYTKNQIDSLVVNLDGGNGTVQSLNLDGENLSISGGNSISFENWDTDAADDFDGDYSSLTGAPKIYTQKEVDNIKAEILKDIEDNYAKKAEIISFTSSRNVNNNDVGNTIACIYSSTLTITSGFSAMQVGDVINLEVQGTTLTVNGSSGVVITGTAGGYSSIGNDEVYTGGLIRKTANNSYIIL